MAKIMISPSCLYGCLSTDQTHFDDAEKISEKNMLKFKIIKLFIYLGYSDGEKAIIGIGCTYKNLLSGNTMNIINKSKTEVEEIKEMDIKGNECLKKLNIQMDSICSFTNLAFLTNKNNKLSFGKQEGRNRIIYDDDTKDNIILGFFGSFSKKLESIGFYSTKRQYIFISYFYGLFSLKFKSNKDKNFRNIWDKKFKELPIDYKFLWKAVNLPDNCKYSFYLIIKYLSPF